ncbi:hypothetical protein GCM10010412_049920 [Nonomuraea recticatena]|uniref:Uncharacterized protein n=1 Tax=Nonomuraea recticatena TaxID=46178 RepID=A0ABP6ELB3_9ACTN
MTDSVAAVLEQWRNERPMLLEASEWGEEVRLFEVWERQLQYFVAGGWGGRPWPRRARRREITDRRCVGR